MLQVNELHRVYRVQKILMKSMGSSWQNGRNQDRWNSKNVVSWNQIDGHHGTQKRPQPTLDLEQPAEEEYIVESDGDGMLEIEDHESEIELTLGLTSYCRREKAETPLTSDSGLSFSSSSSGSGNLKRTSSGTQQRTDKVLSMNSFVVEEELRQDGLKQPPPWLFQALSLNMT
uniref:Uncharacterized protein n=1 Tax=Davidia involucrata TaxID=16924 RepID=A0A5B6Z0F3_DAVIN